MDIVSQHHAIVGSPALTQESSHSAVSWQAIFAGAFVAASASLILAGLGSGFGLASVSPWANSGVSATTFTWMTAVWLVIVQWFASGLGGYLAGRMRTKWTGLHTHEVFFRDTAHGFITWSVATIIVAAFLVSAASSVIGGGVRAAATVASGESQGYAMDTLFRPDHPVASGDAADARDARGETARILANGVATGDVPTADRTYLSQLVAAHTGITQDEAQKRVDTAIAESKAAADKARAATDAARKAAAETAIYTALAMLVGAFIACIAAALGGQRRDLHA